MFALQCGSSGAGSGRSKGDFWNLIEVKLDVCWYLVLNTWRGVIRRRNERVNDDTLNRDVHVEAEYLPSESAKDSFTYVVHSSASIVSKR